MVYHIGYEVVSMVDEMSDEVHPISPEQSISHFRSWTSHHHAPSTSVLTPLDRDDAATTSTMAGRTWAMKNDPRGW